MSSHLDVLDCSARHNQAMFVFEVCLALGCALDDLSCVFTVLGMGAFQHHLNSWIHGMVVFENSKRLLRPDNLSRLRFPTKASGVTEPLRFRQIRFTPTKLLGQELMFRDIERTAYVLFYTLVFANIGTDTPNVADFPIRANDALGSIERQSLRPDSLDEVR